MIFTLMICGAKLQLIKAGVSNIGEIYKSKQDLDFESIQPNSWWKCSVCFDVSFGGFKQFLLSNETAMYPKSALFGLR